MVHERSHIPLQLLEVSSQLSEAADIFAQAIQAAVAQVTPSLVCAESDRD
jgi:hypothetical protein